MTALMLAAFIMGFIGSFHCVGMCGPIALSLPLQGRSDLQKLSGGLLYNFGRIVTYSLFGLLFGFIGKSVALFGFQQWLSVAMGTFILVIVVLPKRMLRLNNQNLAMNFLARFRGALGDLFKKRNYSSLFFIGLLNGLLPCGLVYMASAVAVSTGNILQSMVFMSFFGLGTLPMMWAMAFFGSQVSVTFRQKIRRAYPYLMTVMACLLILRGMGLGINYISPKTDSTKKEVQNCCVKPVTAITALPPARLVP